MGCKKADPGDCFNPCDFEHDNYTLYLSLSQPHALILLWTDIYYKQLLHLPLNSLIRSSYNDHFDYLADYLTADYALSQHP